jgi:hypothetical protein
MKFALEDSGGLKLRLDCTVRGKAHCMYVITKESGFFRYSDVSSFLHSPNLTIE